MFFKLIGSSFRRCFNQNATWSGEPTRCDQIRCKELLHINKNDTHLEMVCTKNVNKYGQECVFKCANGYINIGSNIRKCTSVGWSGMEAKCKMKMNYLIQKTTTTPPLQTSEIIDYYYQDLTNLTLSFDYSFTPVDLMLNIYSLPITFITWLRTKHTKNIRLLQYNYICNQVLILTDSNSSLFININKIYSIKLSKILTKNEWIQIAFIQTDLVWQLFLDGSLRIDINDLRLDMKCNNNNDTIKINEFKIMESLLFDKKYYYTPMRGDLTKTYLFNLNLTEEDVIRNIFICEKYNENHLIFDWSRVLIGSFLKQFKRKFNQFCQNCPQPEFSKNTLINYQGNL